MCSDDVHSKERADRKKMHKDRTDNIYVTYFYKYYALLDIYR